MQLDLSLDPPDLHFDNNLNFTWHVKEVKEDRLMLKIIWECTFCVSVSSTDNLVIDGKMLDAPSFRESIDLPP
jgi:hypothetical protein